LTPLEGGITVAEIPEASIFRQVGWTSGDPGIALPGGGILDPARGEALNSRVKQDADYIFHELTRSICPERKTVIDAYTFSVKRVMKCCVGILVPDGRAIPFSAYNSVGYREQIREQLTLEQARE
jgi:hypothetical protein